MNIRMLFRPTKLKRKLFFLLVDALIFSLSFYGSVLFYGVRSLSVSPWTLGEWIAFITLGKIVFFWLAGIYRFTWRFIGIFEMFKIAVVVTLFEATAVGVNAGMLPLWKGDTLPAGVFLLDLLLSLHGVLMVRSAKRVYMEIFRKKGQAKRTLIIGAGNTAERIARELDRGQDYRPVCFVDDDPNKVGTTIHNIKVRGTLEDIARLLEQCRVEAAIIAIPHLNAARIRAIFNQLVDRGIRDIKIIPSLARMNNPDLVSIRDLRDLSVEDLLAREMVDIDASRVQRFIEGQVVLVTGAGGSIGSEIVRQLCRFRPKKVVALEIDDTELHNLSLEIAARAECQEVDFVPVIADVKDREKIQQVFRLHCPDIVFHAAAYKHVPLMEYFPEEAAKVNILGTYHLARTAVENGVKKFVNISTDKAVNPSSVMGATKRMAEIVCGAFNQLQQTAFMSVRFGNVLGSRGSVIPLFLEQIRKGGPVTVTHPEMKRYFMTISEAVLLVFQAAAMGKGGEVFVLDMGEPVKIVKLSEQLIKLHGLEPYKDIDICFTGLRPGEKLFEELLTAEEGTDKTQHEKIYMARISTQIGPEAVHDLVTKVEQTVQEGSTLRLRTLLEQYVPFYQKKALAEKTA